MHYPSKHLEKAVDEISQLPGIGKRTAMRLALHILRRPAAQTESLSKALIDLVNEIHYCQNCHSICDGQICEICANPVRNQEVVCVVEDIRDVMAIENTGQYKGVYHILGGKISPMEGIGPQQLNIDSLVKKSDKIQEVIFALTSTIEGDTTIFYIYKQLLNKSLKITTIARGIGVGDELEYTDEITLARSIQNRIPYSDSVSNV